jgi:hypothetical protein
MPNGGQMSCADCTYSRLFESKCDIWGTPISGFLLCRAFRLIKQSHTKSRKDFPILNDLEPGFVCEIYNDGVMNNEMSFEDFNV